MPYADPVIDTLLAKQAITEVIYRYCRGMDRMDRELTLSCWHPGGTDDHAPLYKGSAEGFLDWLWPVHRAMVGTRHVIGNILIEVANERAVAESYWNVQLRVESNGRLHDIVGAGRYVDAFERIQDVWAIRHRVSVSDLVRVVEVRHMTGFDPPLIAPNNPQAVPAPSRRDPGDFSYAAFGALRG